MKSKLNPRRLALTLSLALVALLGVVVVNAETIKKLHTSPQLIINSTSFNDTNEPTSSTVDLSGGDLDKCSFVVYVTSSNGSSLLSLAIQVSADGGTTWASTGDTISVSTGVTSTSASTAYSGSKVVAGGTKLRLLPTLSSSTTYYTFKAYAMPSVD